MNYNLLIELNQILRGVFESVNSRPVTTELFDQLATELNTKVHALYEKHGLKSDHIIDRDFVIHMFNLLVEAGGIEVREDTLEETGYSHLNDITPSDPQAHSSVLQDDANLYDPVAAEYDETVTEESPVEILNTLWQKFANNRQFIEAEAIMAGIAALNALYATSPDRSNPDAGFPEGWGENLVGNFDGSHWASEFKVLLDLKPQWATDHGYLTGWFANAIMTGYDKAKQEEFPEAERGEEDYVYVEFYDAEDDSVLGHSKPEVSEVSFKFQTLAAAKEFVKLNAFGDNFKSKYYRYYQLEPTTTLKKTEIK